MQTFEPLKSMTKNHQKPASDLNNDELKMFLKPFKVIQKNKQGLYLKQKHCHYWTKIENTHTKLSPRLIFPIGWLAPSFN